jgi:hypothetical protein
VHGFMGFDSSACRNMYSESDFEIMRINTPNSYVLNALYEESF